VKELVRGGVALLLLMICAGALAVDTTVLPTEALQKRYEALTHELRCMQCQNQSIADSPVDLATGLRRDVREQLIAGRTDAEIRESMVRRYGNAILFRPPLDAQTAAMVDGDDTLADEPSPEEPR
jgi:cytochrome c-type biogenesis protein CcmH